MREHYSTGIPWIENIPVGWKFTKLGRICKIITDGTHQTPNYIEDGYPFISIKDISSGKIDFSDVKYISKEEHKLLYAHAPVKKGDILFTRIGTLGVFVEVDTDKVFDFFVSVGMLRLKPNIINSHYLIHYLNSPAVENFIQAIKAGFGTAAPKYNLTDVKKTWVIVPPENEQNLIASFLDKKCAEIDALSADVQAEIETLEAYKKSVIAEAVTKGLDKNVVMKDSGMAWIGKIPSHWLVEKVKYHLVRREPKNPGEKEVLSVYRDYGVIPKDSRDDNHNVTSEDTSKYKYVKPGNLVINKMKAWQGSMGISAYEGIVSPAYFIYHFTDDLILPTYLHYLFRTCYKDEFRRISGGIREGQWDLSPEAFGNTLLLIPSLQEQKEITEHINIKVKELDELIAQKQEQLTVLADYKKSFIYEYVTGKKEVPING